MRSYSVVQRIFLFFFFFQAEDGIRDYKVTGVQTCALPISLGNFRLEGIQPAPRGAPQIEVSYDIDANGILTVTAKDKQSGKEQKITISGSTQLSKEEIDRMVADAQAHAEEDRKRREEVEARNSADSMAYQVERQISDLGDRVPLNEKA